MPRGRQYYDPIEQHPAIVGGQKDLARIELYPEGGPDEPSPRWCARRITVDGRIAEHTSGDFDHDRALAQAQALWANLPIYELRNEGEDSTWEGMGPSPRLWQNAQISAIERKGNRIEFTTEQSSSPGDADGASREPSPDVPLPDSVGAQPEPGDDAWPKVEMGGTYIRHQDHVEVYPEGEIPPAGVPSLDPLDHAGDMIIGYEMMQEEVAGQLHVLTATAPGTYVRLSDVLALLHGWADQYDEWKNPSAALAVREVAQTLAVTEQGGQ